MLLKMANELRDDNSKLMKLKISSPELVDSYKVFKSHYNKLLSLIAMPEELVALEIASSGVVSARHNANISLHTKKMKSGIGLDEISISKEELMQEVNIIIDQFMPSDLFAQSSKKFKNLINDQEAKNWLVAVNSLKQTSLVQAWTGFESSAKNVWIAAVNARPILLGHPSFNSLTDDIKDGGVNSKTIPVGLAAKYGFDLRTSLGTILSDKYDFTSKEGVKKAYQSSFQNIEPLVQHLDSKAMFSLEKIRNLLVHRAGIIDAPYKNITHCSQECGDELEISDSNFEKYITKSLAAAIEIFRFTDNYLINSKK